MSVNQPNFQSLRNIRDNAMLLSIANEYLAENVYILKIGSEIKKNLNVLNDDIKSLKKQFPGKFTVEINTEKVMSSFEKSARDMISCSDEIKADFASGRLGAAFAGDINRITEDIEKIWQQVKGKDIKYTKTDSINSIISRLNIFPGIFRLFSGIARILLIFFLIALAGFSYLYFTMEKEESIIEENREITASIEAKRAHLSDLEKKKAEAQKSLKEHDDGQMLRKDKIAIIDLETHIQQYNQEIHLVEGQIEARKRSLDKNNKRLANVKGKSFLDRLLKR